MSMIRMILGASHRSNPHRCMASDAIQSLRCRELDFLIGSEFDIIQFANQKIRKNVVLRAYPGIRIIAFRVRFLDRPPKFFPGYIYEYSILWPSHIDLFKSRSHSHPCADQIRQNIAGDQIAAKYPGIHQSCHGRDAGHGPYRQVVL